MQRPPWLAKLIGAAIGFLVLGPFGLFLGLLIGHGIDGAHRLRQVFGPAIAAAQQVFFHTTFTLMGRVAKSDGRISEQEVAVTEQLMTRMGLGLEHRQEAIALFKQGSATDFDVDAQLRSFMQSCGRHPNLRQMLLMFLFSTAKADGSITGPEHELLARIAAGVGISPTHFEQLLRMFTAQEHFSDAPGAAGASRTLDDAYAALGVNATDSDREVKQAYRRLMSQFHPDKLIAEGVPEDMIKLATERTQEIQNAWEQVRKARGI